MTLEELQNKKVTITLEKSFKLGNDLPEELLSSRLKDQKLEDLSNEVFLNMLVKDYYSLWTDFEDVIDSNDFKVTIHD